MLFAVTKLASFEYPISYSTAVAPFALAINATTPCIPLAVSQTGKK